MVDIFASLKNGQGAASIFNAQRNVSRNQLTAQIQNNFQTKIKALETEMQSKVEGRMAIIDRQGAPFSELVSQLRDALDVVENTRKRVETVERKLDEMKNGINRAKTAFDDPDIDFRAEDYARSFDSTLRFIQSEITETRVSPNLLNNSTLPFRYPTSNPNAESSFMGIKLSSEYTITEAGGEKWKVESSSNLIRRYDSAGESTSTVGAFYAGLSFDSIDASDNIQFTIGQGTGSPQTFNGTVERNGIGLLSSFGYNYLSTDADRERAITDINGAEEIIKVEKARYQMLETTLNFYLEKAKGEVEGVNQEKLDTQRELVTELYDKRERLVQQYQATQSSLALSFMQKNNYASLIPISQSFFSVLV